MAFVAFSLFERRVERSPIPFHLTVTTKAKVFFWGGQQHSVRGRMGAMTTGTLPSAGRGMDVDPLKLRDLIVVTAQTQGLCCLGEQPSVRRSMGAMAGGALPLFRWGVTDLPLKGGPFMTFEAEVILGKYQKRPFPCGVGVVT